MASMRLTTLQISAGLLAAVALVMAFIAVGVGLAAGLLALLGVAALAWLGWTLARRALSRTRDKTA